MIETTEETETMTTDQVIDPTLEQEIVDKVYGQRREYDCRHGHYDCATYSNGPCANEEVALALEARRGAH